MIDIEKFICSLINRASGFCVIKVLDIINALHNQGLDYQNGKIVSIEDKSELKESKDEKIKKEIISFLKGGEPYHCPNSRRRQEWAVWLEKQGEHANFLNKIQIGDKVTRNKDGMLVNLSQLNRVAKKDEQNHAWSEEDEETIDNLIDYLENELEISYMKEDKEGFRSQINLLKSLKDRVQSQNHWKPSEEQMDALLSKLPVVKGGGDKVQDILESLYDDLKKLKG